MSLKVIYNCYNDIHVCNVRMKSDNKMRKKSQSDIFLLQEFCKICLHLIKNLKITSCADEFAQIREFIYFYVKN